MIDIVFFNNPLINSTYLYLNDYIKYIFLFTLVIVPVISYSIAGAAEKKYKISRVLCIFFRNNRQLSK